MKQALSGLQKLPKDSPLALRGNGNVTPRSLPSQEYKGARGGKDEHRAVICCLCSLASLLVGVTLVALAIYAKSAKDEYTPVYRTIVCGEHVIEDYSNPSTSTSEIRGSATISYPCENRNPYNVTIADAAVGTISMGQVGALVDIGTIVVLPSVLEQQNRGDVKFLLSVSLEGSAASDLLERFFIGSQNIYLDIPMAIDVTFGALGQSFLYHSLRDKKCGFQMDVDVEPHVQAQWGFVWCAETYESIFIQPLWNMTGSLYTTFPLSEETIESLDYKRDVDLGCALGLGAVAGPCCLLMAALQACRAPASSRRDGGAFICHSEVLDVETESILNGDASDNEDYSYSREEPADWDEYRPRSAR